MCFKITWRILIIASKVKSTEKMNIGGGGALMMVLEITSNKSFLFIVSLIIYHTMLHINVILFSVGWMFKTTVIL